MVDAKEELSKIIRADIEQFCKDATTFYKSFKAQINRQIKETNRNKSFPYILSDDELRIKGEDYAKYIINLIYGTLENISFKHLVSVDIENKYIQYGMTKEIERYCTDFARKIIRDGISSCYQNLKNKKK